MFEETGVDKSALGKKLKAIRSASGCTNTQQFADLLAEKAGYHVSKDVVYHIESGRREAPVSYLCAVSIATSGRCLSSQIGKIIKESCCQSWQEADAETYEKQLKKRFEYMFATAEDEEVSAEDVIKAIKLIDLG